MTISFYVNHDVTSLLNENNELNISEKSVQENEEKP